MANARTVRGQARNVRDVGVNGVAGDLVYHLVKFARSGDLTDTDVGEDAEVAVMEEGGWAAGAGWPEDGQLDSALLALSEAHGAALLSFLLRLTNGDRRKSERLLRETLVRALRYPDIHPGIEPSRPWLFMVARRVAIDHFRASPRRVEVGDERLSEHPGSHDGVEHVGDRAEILRAVRDLPAGYRDVLAEIFGRGRSAAEAAEILGVSEETIKSRTFSALRALRERLVERGLLPTDPP